jgi:uncharacterized membrane protein HdeD (DUF308 family)
MNFAADVAQSIQQAHKYWGWFMAAGVALIVLGCLAVWSQGLATIASIVALGTVLLLTGVVQVVAAFMSRGAGHVILLLLVGILDGIVGIMLMNHPDAGALTVTLLLAALFVFVGIYRFVAAMWLQFPQYGWVAFSALISILLGVLLWLQWPTSAAWFIGFAVGIAMIFDGIGWCSVSLKLKNIP